MKKQIMFLLLMWASLWPVWGCGQTPDKPQLIPWSEFKGDTIAYLESNFSSYTYYKRYYPNLKVSDVFSDLEIPVKAIYVDIMPGDSKDVRSIYLLFHSAEYARIIPHKDGHRDIGILLYPALDLHNAERERFEALGQNRTEPFYRVWSDSLYRQIKEIGLNNAYASYFTDRAL